MSEPTTIGVVACAAGGVEKLRVSLVRPLLQEGLQVAVTLTPGAAVWLDASSETAEIERETGLPVRAAPRLPDEPSPHPKIDCYVVAPATANFVAKLALGIADNQALTQVNEALTLVPVVVFPRVNAAHARHPAWSGHLLALRSAGVELIYGEDVWPLHEPRSAPGRELPWSAVVQATCKAVATR